MGSPLLELPLGFYDAASNGHAPEVPISLHVESRRARLWALSSRGSIQAWSLFADSPELLGRWTPRLEVDTLPLKASAICEHPDGDHLIIAGRTLGSSDMGRPVLAHTRISLDRDSHAGPDSRL